MGRKNKSHAAAAKKVDYGAEVVWDLDSEPGSDGGGGGGPRGRSGVGGSSAEPEVRLPRAPGAAQPPSRLGLASQQQQVPSNRPGAAAAGAATKRSKSAAEEDDDDEEEEEVMVVSDNDDDGGGGDGDGDGRKPAAKRAKAAAAATTKTKKKPLSRPAAKAPPKKKAKKKKAGSSSDDDDDKESDDDSDGGGSGGNDESPAPARPARARRASAVAARGLFAESDDKGLRIHKLEHIEPDQLHHAIECMQNSRETVQAHAFVLDKNTLSLCVFVHELITQLGRCVSSVLHQFRRVLRLTRRARPRGGTCFTRKPQLDVREETTLNSTHVHA